ncbi:MAG: acyl-CoA dehydrogenase family protein [Bacillota bacterium]
MSHYIFSDEHEQLRKSVRRFVERELAPYADEWEAAEGFPDEVFRKLGAQGFLGLRYPEEYGGQGGDYYTAIVLAEELVGARAGGVGTAVEVHTEMATPPILKFGTDDQKRRFLVPAIKGEKISALAITEPEAGSDVAAIRTMAVRDGDEYVLNGSKRFITNGCRADFAVVVTRTAKEEHWAGLTLFIVEKGTPGFTVAKKLEKVGLHSSDTAELVFEDCRVPAANLLGQEHQGFYHIMWELQGERLIGAAGAVAAGQRALDLAIQYGTERQQFGRPVAKFQANRHRLAEHATALEAARQMVYASAWRVQNGEYPVKEISMAKVFSTRVAFEAADFALQLHGGSGYMMESEIQRLWRDTRASRIAAGTDEIMLEVVAKELGL